MEKETTRRDFEAQSPLVVTRQGVDASGDALESLEYFVRDLQDIVKVDNPLVSQMAIEGIEQANAWIRKLGLMRETMHQQYRLQESQSSLAARVHAMNGDDLTAHFDETKKKSNEPSA